MSGLEEQLGKDDHINIILLKQLLSEDKKLPRHWVNALVERYIAILSTPGPIQSTNPT